MKYLHCFCAKSVAFQVRKVTTNTNEQCERTFCIWIKHFQMWNYKKSEFEGIKIYHKDRSTKSSNELCPLEVLEDSTTTTTWLHRQVFVAVARLYSSTTYLPRVNEIYLLHSCLVMVMSRDKRARWWVRPPLNFLPDMCTVWPTPLQYKLPFTPYF